MTLLNIAAKKLESGNQEQNNNNKIKKEVDEEEEEKRDDIQYVRCLLAHLRSISGVDWAQKKNYIKKNMEQE